MFSGMIAALHKSRMPEQDALQKRYDFALTKKMGIIKLPPAFWMEDPKINPRSDHLFWASLLLKDRDRIEMALSVIAVELSETTSTPGDKYRQRVDARAMELTVELLEQFQDSVVRQQFEQDLCNLALDWLALTCEKSV